MFNKQFALRAGKSLALGLMVAAPMAFAGGETEAHLETIKIAILALITAAVAAGFLILAASLTPDVGMGLIKKWVKKAAK